jgi:PiT family inorganic phosphate transporter
MAFSHGSNDGQKFIGVFSLALVLGGVLPEFQVPLWVILLCASTMGIGTAVGGWRIIRTMGIRLTRSLSPTLWVGNLMLGFQGGAKHPLGQGRG